MKILKSLNRKNTHLTRQGVRKSSCDIIHTNALASAFVNLDKQIRIIKTFTKMENFMKKILLTLISFVTFNYALADENTPVTFQTDQ